VRGGADESAGHAEAVMTEERRVEFVDGDEDIGCPDVRRSAHCRSAKGCGVVQTNASPTRKRLKSNPPVPHRPLSHLPVRGGCMAYVRCVALRTSFAKVGGV
jgi:hypothetical protein